MTNIANRSKFSLIAVAALAGLICLTSTGCSSEQPSQQSAPAPSQTKEPPTATPESSVVVARGPLETLPAPLDAPVPVVLQTNVPVTKDGYEGWYAVATTQVALVDGVLADWESWLLSNGYDVERGENSLNARLSDSAESPSPDPATTAAVPTDQSTEQDPGQEQALPRVMPGDTAWVQIRVLSSTGSEHAQRPQDVHLALAYLSRA